MTHVLIFYGDPEYAGLLTVLCEDEGYTVTVTHTVDDTLMVLRTTLHPVIVVATCDHSCLHPDGSFFQTIRDRPDLYGHHQYIGLQQCWQLSKEEVALLDGLGVIRISAPFGLGELAAVLAQVTRWI